ncbi:MAG: CvpA family protein [Burkholderiaceae bacterium]
MNLLPAWLDIVLGAVLAISMVVGIMRGLVFEMLSVVGWFVAYFCAQWLAPGLATYIPAAVSGAGTRQAMAFAAIFIAVLLIWSLVSRALRALIRSTPPSSTDRMLGAGFGLARGVVLLLALATVIRLTPLSEAGAWRQSTGAAWLESALRGLKPILPSGISQHLPD